MVSLFCTDQHNRVHSSGEVPRSFTLAPCVVVERLEGKQRCSRAAVGERTGIQAQEWPKWLFMRNERSMENDQTLQQPITQSRKRGAQTTPAHLHWCGADPPHVAGHKGHPPKWGYIFAIFAGFPNSSEISRYRRTSGNYMSLLCCLILNDIIFHIKFLNDIIIFVKIVWYLYVTNYVV